MDTVKSGVFGTTPPTERVSKRRQRLRGTFAAEELWGYLFILPQTVGLLLFVIFPVVASLLLCFANWNFVKAPKFTGLDNFKDVLTDPYFHTALGNTFAIVLMLVPLTVTISLGLALLTNRKLLGLSIFKAGFFLPMITTAVAIAMVWYWLFAPDFGLINAFLGVFGIRGPGWLTDPKWAKPAVVTMLVWQAMGYYYLLFLAGLKQIPVEYYEAAAIDGAGRWQQFRSITLPLLSPTTFFIVTTMFIGAFTTFDVAYVLTRGGPVYSTYTLVMYIYEQAFSAFEMGNAAVASWVLFVILFIVTFVQFRLSKRWVHYDQ
jgi:multiple sugar transport system permease protein